jgi:creatinine amidohydrolase
MNVREGKHMQDGGYSVFHGTMADMTYLEVVDAAKRGAVVLWGLGVIEQHGPHLPLATDVYIPYALLRRAAEVLNENGVPSVIMPPFYWGINHVTARFPATFEVRPEVMVEVMVDLIKSLKKDNFRNLFCISGHGDPMHNWFALQAIKRGGREADINAYFVCTPPFLARLKTNPDFDPADATVVPAEHFLRPTSFVDVHAGEIETSSMWAKFPNLVRKEVLPTLKSTDYGPDDLTEWRKGGEHALRKTPDGYLGDPAASNREKGEEKIKEDGRLLAEAMMRKLKENG